MKRYLSLLTALAALAALLTLVVSYACALPSEASPAQVIQVTTTNPGSADDGECSLVEAIVNANADAAIHDDCPAGSGADTIVLGLDDVYTLVGAYGATQTGLPSITSTVTISGNGSTVERSSAPATPNFRLFHVGAGGDLTLDSLTVRGGQVAAPAAGGGILIHEGTLALNGSTVTANTSPWGGGIYNHRGGVALSHSAVSSNTAGYSGGGIESYEGALVISDSEIGHNTAANGFGGGVMNYLYHVTQTAVVTIENSILFSNTAALYGGGLYNESGDVKLNDSEVSHNVAQEAGGGIDSQAIRANTAVELNSSLIAKNKVLTRHGGGGISNASTSNQIASLTLNHSVVEGNIAAGTAYTMAFGGGIFNGFFVGSNGATSLVTLNESVVSGNQAINGGGIGNGTLTPGGLNLAHVTLNNSTVSMNKATLTQISSQTGNGGGVMNINGSLALVNSTVGGNLADGDPTQSSGLGGGIANVAGGLPTLVLITNTTIVDNAAGAGGGLANAYLPPVPGYGPANVILKNSLIARNSDLAGATGCLNNPGVGAAAIASNGYNLEDSITCGFAQPTDLPNTDPLLDVLENNGGRTETFALAANSPAVDAGSCPGFVADQRGKPRPVDASTIANAAGGDGCDIGAFEAQFEIVFTKTVGLDPAECASTDAITLTPGGGDVVYCYQVENTGQFTLTLHDLWDDQLGTIFEDEADDLEPGWLGWLTKTAHITQTTVNTATWTAYNPGPADVLSATDIATVTVESPPRHYVYLPLVTR